MEHADYRDHNAIVASNSFLMVKFIDYDKSKRDIFGRYLMIHIHNYVYQFQL